MPLSVISSHLTSWAGSIWHLSPELLKKTQAAQVTVSIAWKVGVHAGQGRGLLLFDLFPNFIFNYFNKYLTYFMEGKKIGGKGVTERVVQKARISRVRIPCFPAHYLCYCLEYQRWLPTSSREWGRAQLQGHLGGAFPSEGQRTAWCSQGGPGRQREQVLHTLFTVYFIHR